ncbi:MAG TPA: hypothetical protein VFW56_15280 [Bradyrhizobium sp.]|jgi:hypothetical protein|nr:hypothetical protein [Bradyrhizobium sp.]
MAKETAASMVRAAAMPTTTTIKNVRMTLPPVSPALEAKDGQFREIDASRQAFLRCCGLSIPVRIATAASIGGFPDRCYRWPATFPFSNETGA